MSEKTYLGIEFGSTRIKAVSIDGTHKPVSSGDYTWQSDFENGVWTYPMEKVWAGLKTALRGVSGRESIASAGISAMMHGYLAFDRDWNLLVPFRTWQNTMTGPAAAELSGLFRFNIPQRWSIAHLYQAILNGEPHVKDIAHITTLAGYVHFMLTGVNAVGIGEASGIFPVDPAAGTYDARMMSDYDALAASHGFHTPIRELIPDVRVAGEGCGALTEAGAALLEGLLPVGLPFCPPEGDAETGMTATNAVAPRTGNVSAGTSIFSMIVLERPLKQVYPEVGVVMTPTGAPVAMVHCSNCTSDMNGWVSLLGEAVELFGGSVDKGELYTRLYRKSLEGEADCGGVSVVNYLTGESVTHLDRGVPLILREPGTPLTLANLLRAQLYSAMATLSIGMEILADEGVAIDSLTGHGGLFKTPGVGQRYLAAACNAPVTVMETAGEGGPYGMALLAAYLIEKGPGETLEDYLSNRVFREVKRTTLAPDPADAEGFRAYLRRFRAALEVERAAVQTIKGE